MTVLLLIKLKPGLFTNSLSLQFAFPVRHILKGSRNHRFHYNWKYSDFFPNFPESSMMLPSAFRKTLQDARISVTALKKIHCTEKGEKTENGT